MTNRVSTEAAHRSTPPGRLRWALTSLGAAAALAACGGGGGGDDPAPEPEPPAPVATTLSGTAATGAPFAGAALQVTDASGASVCDTTTAADGSFSCTLAPTVARPLVLRAAKDEQVLYSATAATGDTRANVTPLTTIIAARLAPNGDPSKLAASPQSVTADALQAQSNALLAALQPLLTALGLTIDPIAGALTADGSGQDKLLDTISVSVRPDGSGANIELTVKTIPVAGNLEPVSIQFRSDTASIPALSGEEVTAQTVAPVPGPSIVADFFARLTACYALPLSQRVNAPNDSTSVTGGPADVIAPQCRGLFVDDDPATYLSSGSRVGRNAANAGSFAGLFRPAATGSVFSPYGVEYFRGNAEGDMVVSGYWQATNGERANDVYVVRNVNGSLKLIGNQYAYPSAVRPFAEDREFLNTPQFSYYNTGYNLRVNNWTDSNGDPIFRKVLVTPPWGGTPITLLPAAGQALLAISLDGATATGTSILRLGAAYYDPAASADPPWVKDPVATVGTPFSDAQISALNDKGLWTFEFFFADTSMPNVIQRNRTLNRPFTVAEVRQRPFAHFVPSARANLIADSATTGNLTYSAPAAAEIGTAASPAWTVPSGALAPTSVGVFGRAPFGSRTPGVSGSRYDDFANVPSTARYATMFCSAQSAADKHCDPGGQGRYATGSTITMLELWGLNDRQIELSKKAALYKLQ